MKENLDITIQIEGLDAEQGHMRLEDFLDDLSQIRQSMIRVDELIDGKRSANFRIVDATHSSPLTLTLQLTQISTKRYKPTRDRVVRFHHKYFQELSSLARGESPSDDVDDATLEILKGVADGKGKSYKSLTIKNSASAVGIDAKFQKTVADLLSNQIVSYGSMVGSLDALNVHGEQSNMIWIYPSTGPVRVACKVSGEYKELVSKSARKIVKVTGRKHYRAGNAHPHLIEVEEMELVPIIGKEDHISSMRGAFKGGDGNMELANCAIDEW